MGIAELTAKIESLSAEDYNMVIMLVNKLSEKPENNGLKKIKRERVSRRTFRINQKKVTLEQRSQQEQFQRA